ncbi:MAG: hypothetical protein J6A92_07905 [Lachnospiraceae bacterium]|nr:hypothetical protein [Lachnospiraceae bacterium]
MFSQQIEQLWQKWYETEKPRKTSWYTYALYPICLVLAIVGIVMYFKFSEISGAVLAFISFGYVIFAACNISSRQAKMTQSAVAFCWENHLYDTDRGVQFPFLHTNAQYVMGGKRFSYKHEIVTFYDTYYASQNNSPGIVVEIEPLYSVGKGIPVWKKNQVIVPDELGLRAECLACIEQIMDYKYHHYCPHPKCYRNEDKFYLYVVHTAMGLIVQEDGTLYGNISAAGSGELWKGADCLVNILEKNLNN